MNDELFQQILDEISPFLPGSWSRMIYRCFYTAGSWSMKFYADRGDGVYVDCFKLLPSGRQEILRAFQRLGRITAQARDSAPDGAKWTALTLSVSSDGNFHADFDYQDLSESMVFYAMEWEKKYLNG